VRLPIPERWLTYPEAARRAEVTVRQVQTWRAAGLEGRTDERGRWLVEEQTLMEWARGQAMWRSRFTTHVNPKKSRRVNPPP